MTHSSILEFHANGEILKFFSVFYGNCLVLLTDLKSSVKIISNLEFPAYVEMSSFSLGNVVAISTDLKWQMGKTKQV